MKKLSLLNIYENIIDEFGTNNNMFPNFDLGHFKQLNTFNKRIQYCNQTLKRIASGSSRIVYQIDSGSVLKLAKNKFGLEQNRAEGNEFGDDFFSDIRTNVLDYDRENDLWIVSELATKITPAIFKQYTGFDLKKIDSYINLEYSKYNGKKIKDQDYLTFLTPQEKDDMDNSEFIELLRQFMLNNGLSAGDLGRISSWGLVDRNGYKRVVLTDYGFKGYD